MCQICRIESAAKTAYLAIFDKLHNCINHRQLALPRARDIRLPLPPLVVDEWRDTSLHRLFPFSAQLAVCCPEQAKLGPPATAARSSAERAANDGRRKVRSCTCTCLYYFLLFLSRVQCVCVMISVLVIDGLTVVSSRS